MAFEKEIPHPEKWTAETPNLYSLLVYLRDKKDNSALHNPIEDFDQLNHKDFRHTNDIVKKNGVFITLDHKMMGVAGDDSWGARPYPEYSVPAQNYRFKFMLEPVF